MPDQSPAYRQQPQRPDNGSGGGYEAVRNPKPTKGRENMTGHNPWSATCVRRVHGEPIETGSVCPTCDEFDWSTVPLGEVRLGALVEQANAYQDAVKALQEVYGGSLSTTLGYLIRQGYLVRPALLPKPQPAEDAPCVRLEALRLHVVPRSEVQVDDLVLVDDRPKRVVAIDKHFDSVLFQGATDYIRLKADQVTVLR